MKRRIRGWAEVGEAAGPQLADQVHAQQQRLRARMAQVGCVLAVASGKGGVGKSFVAANVAAALAARGLRVGALDADLNGPCLAAMLNAERAPLRIGPDGVRPARGRNGCLVMSSDLLLECPDSPLQWHGPQDGAFAWQSTLEAGMLREFLSDVAWGELDVLILDLPPGTDRITRTLAMLPETAALLMVTTPSRAAASVVARALTCVRASRVAHIGIVRNMEGVACRSCATVTPLFIADAAADEPHVWARLPFDPAAAEAVDAGRPMPADSILHAAFDALAGRVLTAVGSTTARRTGPA